MAHLLPINKKEFYIDLHESRYYFPGDTLKGTVVLNLSKPTKTNHIRITLTGTVQADGSTAQVLHTSWCLASSPLNDGKPHLLPAQTHRLPFEFTLPNDDDSNLPSSLKLSSSMGVKYVITAVHDRPYVPERLCSVIKKEIRVLERIDITQPKYGARAHVAKDVRVFGGLPPCSDKVHLSLTLPQYAVVRGDVLPMEIYIKHYRKLTRVDGIKVYLIRRVYTGKERKKSERKSITSNTLAIDITSQGEFEQKIGTKLLIPTNTPPTLSQTGRILAIEYAARVVININDSYAIYPKNNVKLESHVVIGTYPKPNLFIDDDDDVEDGDSDNVVEADGTEDIGGSDDDDDNDNDNEEEDDKGTTNQSSAQSSPAHIFEPPVMRHSSSTDTTQQQQHQRQQRDPRYSPTQRQSSMTVVDPTTPPPTSAQKTLPCSPSSSPALPPKQYLRQQQQHSSSSLHIVDPTVPSKQYQPRQQPSSSSSLNIIDPTMPSKQYQRPQQQQSSSSLTVIDPTTTTPPIPHRQQRHSSSPSLTMAQPTVPPKQPQRPQQHQQTSSSSLTIVDPTTPPISTNQYQPPSSASSSPSTTVVDPTIPPNQPQRPQSHQSSSSSVTVVDPTAPTVSIHKGRRQSYLPRHPPSSTVIIDPTTTTTTATLEPRRHPHRQSIQQQQQQQQQSFQGGPAHVIDPTTSSHYLHRHESTFSYTSSSSGETTSSSSNSSHSSNATLVEPTQLMKPDRNHAFPSPFTPTSPAPAPAPTVPPSMGMASMPDIAAYVPSKSSGVQQKKRPPLHLNPIATLTSRPLSSSSYPATVGSPSTATSPGGFVVPMPIHPTHHTLVPPPLPPRRPSTQPPPAPSYYYPPNYNQYPPPHPWS